MLDRSIIVNIFFDLNILPFSQIEVFTFLADFVYRK